jgi:hypothetical protein
MRISIMQPYFLPYAGYFRLMYDVDAFVVYDTAQFPRESWVHRNRLYTGHGSVAWLTLPLAYSPLGTTIREMAFHEKADTLWPDRLGGFPACTRPSNDALPVVEQITRLTGALSDFLADTLKQVRDMLAINTPFLFASSLSLPPSASRQHKLIAICKELGARSYVNSPGGRPLYRPDDFARHGITLRFLPEYRGSGMSILQRLQDEPPSAIRSEIETNMY